MNGLIDLKPNEGGLTTGNICYPPGTNQTSFSPPSQGQTPDLHSFIASILGLCNSLSPEVSTADTQTAFKAAVETIKPVGL